MRYKLGITLFGITEILIGSITLIAIALSLVQGTSAKPLEVLIFVIVTGIISLSLGVGVLRRSLHSYHMLLFFATVIILSKVLIFAKIMSLTGELEKVVPMHFKNVLSIIYHGLLIYFFSRPEVKKEFGERRSALFSVKLPFM